MKKMLLMLALAASVPAYAEWISYQRGTEVDELVDSQPVARNGGRVTVWTLTNYAKPMTTLEGQDYGSEKMLTTVDCTARKAGAEQVIRYSGTDAGGDVISSMETPLRLVGVKAGSTEEALLARICP
jgi:hypothetical protein